MYSKKKLVLTIFALCVVLNARCDHRIAERALLFPRYTVLQLTYGVSAPLILPSRVLNLSLCIQSNYDEPYNITNLSPITYARSSEDSDVDVDRFTMYQYIISALDGIGFNGEDCLYRSICEVAHVPLHTDGEESLLEKIVHYILTPSTDLTRVQDCEIILAQNASLTFGEKLLLAEVVGRERGHCDEIYKECGVSFVDLFSAQYSV